MQLYSNRRLYVKKYNLSVQFLLTSAHGKQRGGIKAPSKNSQLCGWKSSLSYLVYRLPDVMAHVFVCELHPLRRRVGVFPCFLQGVALRRHAEHAPAVRHDVPVIKLRSGMETIISFVLLKLVETFNRVTFLVADRIPFACQYHADRRVVLELVL